ncbi:cytochrome c [Pontibacter sp. BT310]|uniref:Cytochrome c n=1 Tax=Pontibacter populi TaxID=890055 RepID=A0ABS6XCU7_9BACT|nr:MULTISPECIES: cytochrome c [Pontibacter]MBJ6118966.1 cytochrome c [Pontibacter sp. BT310]MBR0571394.1 cytochrome c [Microvirga sp. STS03]MBW3365820.1 cytochrome c [Pontibacter populi]
MKSFIIDSTLILKAARLLTLMALPFTLQSCYYDVEEELYQNVPCVTDNVTFSQTIQPIFQRNCVVCHTGAAGNGGIDLSTHAGASVVAKNGRLVSAVTHAGGFTPMPQGASQLPACTINQIKAWVEAGAPNN